MSKPVLATRSERSPRTPAYEQARRRASSALRGVRAGWRDTLVLLREFRGPLLSLGLVIAAASLVYYYGYRHPEYPYGLMPLEAVYAAVTLIIAQPVVPFPNPATWYIEVLYFLMPLAGIALAGQGVVDFVTLLFNRRARAEEWQVAVISTLSGHIIVAGVGHLGYRIITELLALGEHVVAIEREADASLRERIASEDVPVLTGDARRADVLARAGVGLARAIVVCTDDDLANIEIGVRARELNPQIRVVLRMFDDEFARKLAVQVGFETALSTSALSAPAFAGAAVSTEISQSFYVGDRVVSASQVIVGAKGGLVGRTIGAVEHEFDLSVLLHQRGTAGDLHPEPTVTLAAGDQIIVFAEVPVLARVNRLNRSTGAPTN